MQKVDVSLENCYGIKALNYTFDFSRKSTYAIYSPNGTMKSSFAKSFKDLSEEVDSEDLIFSNRSSNRIIQDENGNSLDALQVFVIEPYAQNYKSGKLSTLLVNQQLKERYEAIHNELNSLKETLLSKIKRLTGLKKDVESSFSKAFTHSPKEFYRALSRVQSEVMDSDEPRFSGIIYNKIFTEKVVKFIETEDFKEKISDYIEKYDELIDASTYFKKGIFNHNNASVIAQNLKNNGFFDARHSLYLKSGKERREIKNQAELEEVINQEKEAILNNPGLVEVFDRLDAKLKANKELRDFRDYLLANQMVLPELANLDSFEQKLWISYLKTEKVTFLQLAEKYNDGKSEIELIVEDAKSEETEWRRVVSIFNQRFSVPFQLSVENQDEVILQSESPSIKFTFNDAGDNKSIGEKDLLQVLSNGEKRALYILNIIFEVEARKARNHTTLFVVDDIADSFDYKNKYAIIEYLKDISQHEGFFQILLSHNFDFFRTVCGRLDMSREHKLNTIKTDDGVKLIQEKYQKNPFIHWRENLHQDDKMLIASIPFIRNMAEYQGDDDCFELLTSLLHVKSNTSNVTIENLGEAYESILRNFDKLQLQNQNRPVIRLITEVADTICQDYTVAETIDLEGKIALSIAIRLQAENHMISHIQDSQFVNSITSNQTFELYEKYIELNKGNWESKDTIEKVCLMTPENIHVNSFMYEPILDMSNHSLVSLYLKAKECLLCSEIS